MQSLKPSPSESGQNGAVDDENVLGEVAVRVVEPDVVVVVVVEEEAKVREVVVVIEVVDILEGVVVERGVVGVVTGDFVAVLIGDVVELIGDVVELVDFVGEVVVELMAVVVDVRVAAVTVAEVKEFPAVVVVEEKEQHEVHGGN